MRSARQAQQWLPVLQGAALADPNGAQRFGPSGLLPVKMTRGCSLLGRAVRHPKQISILTYQLDLVTPAIKPCEASSRKVRRDILKRRIKARLRPVTKPRFTTHLGPALRANFVHPA